MREKRRRFLALLLCFAMIFNICPSIPAQAFSNGTISVLHDGEAADDVVLPQNEKIQLEVDSRRLGNCEYQWQILAFDSIWVDIAGADSDTLELSNAMVASLLSDDEAAVRCKMSDGESVVYSSEVIVAVDYDAASGFHDGELEGGKKGSSDDAEIASSSNSSSNASVATSSNASNGGKAVSKVFRLLRGAVEKYSIVINYVFKDGKQAANSWSATVAAGSDFTQSVDSPEVLGYEPDQKSVELDYTDISENKTVTVTYEPALVDYTVKHYRQNLDNDQYTLFEEENREGYTESVVGSELAESYEGFYALLYDTQTEIAADGSTVVEIYYDRYYYLMTFDLDGGFGVEPIYARYGTAINIGNPEKAGYSFGRWTAEDGVEVSIPQTMPAVNTKYKAVWTLGNTTFVVEYMLEDPNEAGKYNFWGSRTISANTDDVVNGESYKDYSSISTKLDYYERKYSSYSHADENVTVKGDGTTVVHVYYNRDVYTLKFYYAMSSESWGKTTYYVIGGTTYYFGKMAAVRDTGNEVALLDQYMNTHDNERGVVNSMPALNEAGEARGYTKGTDTSNVNYTNYTYYYISFDAKYGADLTDLWPSDVFNSVDTDGNSAAQGWNGKAAYVSAWNGEHHVYYSQHNSNQTIKGKYAQLDYQLLWDETYGEPADHTVSYLCFWENGADINWSVPELYRYNIYVPVLDGQDITGLTTKTYNGTTYYLRDQYNTVDDSDVANQTHPALEGFTENGRGSSSISDFDKNLYKEAWDVYFYYTRNTYDLQFFNGGSQDKVQTVPFEMPLKDYNYVPNYPSNLESNAYVFDGWYTSPFFTEGTKVDFETAVMPAGAQSLYACWTPMNHSVRLYPTEADMEAKTNQIGNTEVVAHGSTAAKPEDPVNGLYTFVGWFYQDGGMEKAFDFSMPVNRDLDLYAKWSSNVLMQYTIKYAVQNEDQTLTYIAADTVGSALAGTTKTFEAKAGDELNEGYQSGYFPMTNSHSITIDIKDTGKNEYTFIYVPRDEVPYTVQYLEFGTENVLHDEKRIETRDAVITENFEPITGYMPDAYQKRLVLSADESQNVIVFWYVKDDTHAPVRIIHYIQNVEGDGYAEYQSSTDLNGMIGQDYSTNVLTISGYTYNHAAANHEPVTASDDKVTGQVTADGLILELYYNRNEYPYEFRFLEQGTNTVLADPVTGTGRYGAQVTENAKTIPGYTCVSADAQAITIQIENGDAANKNVRTFYYTEQEVEIRYTAVGPDGETSFGSVTPESESVQVFSGSAAGSVPTAAEGYYFVGWFRDEACMDPVTGAGWIDGNKIVPQKTKDYDVSEAEKPGYEAKTYYAKFDYAFADLTIKKNGAVDANHVFIFRVENQDGSFSMDVTIKGNGSVTLKDLPIDTYTVTELSDWSWRYRLESIRADHDAEVNASNPAFRLNVNGETITFTNNLENNKWVDGNTRCQNIFRDGGVVRRSNVVYRKPEEENE